MSDEDENYIEIEEDEEGDKQVFYIIYFIFINLGRTEYWFK